MSRIITISAIVVVALAALLVAPGAGQDRTSERLSALETRVAALEEIVSGADAAPTGETHELQGSLILDADAVEFETTIFCASGWNDLPVTVKDGSGAVIAAGLLELGDLVEQDCHLPFEIEDLPESTQYVFEIRDHSWTFAYQDLAARNWIVELVIDS